MISVHSLIKSYGGKEVLHIDSLSIDAHSCFGLVGNNGAGKTTLFRLILDLIQSDSGSVSSFGSPVAGSEEWKAYTASFLDDGFLIPFLSPEEYFSFVGKAYDLPRAEIEKRLAEFDTFFNGEVLGQKKLIRDFSAGNKRRIGIVGAMIVRPEVLVLDEPFANLDPSSQLKLVKLLSDLAAMKTTTMLISSHDLSHITKVCDRIALIERGKVIRDTVKTDDTLKELEHYFAAS